MNRGLKGLVLAFAGVLLVCAAAGVTGAQDDQGIMFLAKKGSGFTNASLEGKTYYFRMLELEHAPLLSGHEAVVMDGLMEFKNDGTFEAMIWLFESDGTRGGPVSDNGPYSVSSDGSFTVTTEAGSGPVIQGNISADGSFITLSRCENQGEDTIQIVGVAVERDIGQTFVQGDINGRYGFHRLGIEDVETDDLRAAAVNATIDADGNGNWMAFYAATKSSGEIELNTASGTYTVQPDGSFTFYEGATPIFSGYISKNKDKLIFTEGRGTSPEDTELAVAAAHKIDAGHTYSAADLDGDYFFRLMALHDIETPGDGEFEIICGAVNMDGVGDWTISSLTVCDEEGNSETATSPPADLPFGVYFVESDGTLILIPNQADASPGEMWWGSYSVDAQSAVLARAPSIASFTIEAGVVNVHQPDNENRTYFHIDVYNFVGVPPDEIDEVVDSIVVIGPNGPLPLSKADFAYYPQWQEFFATLNGSPDIGTYTFFVTSGSELAMAQDVQEQVIDIPLPNLTSPTDGETLFTTTPEFCWDEVTVAGMTSYYRLEIKDPDTDSRVYATSRVAGMLCHTPPYGYLQPGETYGWRVRVLDDDDWLAVQNRSHSDWQTVTVFGALLDLSIPSEAVESAGTLTGAGTVSISEALPFDVTIDLSSSDETEVTVPAQVVISAGGTSVSFDVTIVDDDDFDGIVPVTVTAASTGLNTDTAVIAVADDDDTDGDGLDDQWERDNFEGSLDRDGTGDYDDDFLTDADEHEYGTEPDMRDTEGDGMPDKWEINHGCDPLVDDSAACLADYLADRPEAPALLEPGVEVSTGLEQGVPMPPVLTTDVFVDNGDDNHGSTEWKVSTGYDGMDPDVFEVNLVYHAVSRLALLKNQMPDLLDANTIYYWQTRVFDDEGADSDWSETFAFETGPTPYTDNNGNNIPDSIDLQAGDEVDLNENGMWDENEPDVDNWKCFHTRVNSGPVAVGVPAGNVVNSVDSVDPEDIDDDIDRPGQLPWGLIGFNVAVAPGATIDITLTLEGLPPANAEWHLWTAAGGWQVYPATITQTAAGNTQVVITKTDGGIGDADGLENGVIVDPGGLAAAAAQQPAPPPGGGGGGCFISTAVK